MGKILRVVVVAGICLLLVAFLGCAQKAAVKDESAGQQKAVVQAPAAKQPEVKVEEQKKPAEAAAVYELSNIYFDFDKSVIKKDAKDVLKKHAAWLKANNAVNVTVAGNCDERGTAEYNLALGQRRANAAAKFLVDSGVAKKRIKTVSYGKEKPIDPGHNEEAWAKNRRDEFVINK
jgi:peptidoglycan-associated lipoprotein